MTFVCDMRVMCVCVCLVYDARMHINVYIYYFRRDISDRYS